MNELTVFNNAEFGEVRTTSIGDCIYFCLADVCKALDISNSRDVKTRLNQDGVVITDTIDNLGRKQNATFINESNLYKVIFQSRKESAERFTDWVTNDVLPQIRKTGAYNLPQTYTEALEHLLATTKEKERLALENEEMKPKALFADAVTSSDDTISMGELSKLLEQNGIKIGRNRLYDNLRANSYIMKHSTEPTQKAMELGLFEMKENVIADGKGGSLIRLTTRVTGKGQKYFVNHFLKAR